MKINSFYRDIETEMMPVNNTINGNLMFVMLLDYKSYRDEDIMQLKSLKPRFNRIKPLFKKTFLKEKNKSSTQIQTSETEGSVGNLSPKPTQTQVLYSMVDEKKIKE